MIKNERQYLITKKQAQKFRDALAASRAAPTADSDQARQAKAWQEQGLAAQLATLEGEIRLYEDLQRAPAARTFRVPLEQFAALLIQARIARGWSQRELGERLGLQMQKIQQYEASDYAGASLTRLLEICQALGLTGEIAAELVALPASLTDRSDGADVGASSTSYRSNPRTLHAVAQSSGQYNSSRQARASKRKPGGRGN